MRVTDPSVFDLFANEDAGPHPEAQIFVNVSAVDERGWVQLAPYGDFINVDSQGRRVIQRFQRPDAETIVNEFNALLNIPQRLLGLPWYIGHPDHPRFKAIHTDTKAYARVKKLEARDDGLYANVKFGAAGQQLLDDEAFHGHSVNWRAIPTERENGMQIFRPVSLKSVGFTNDPAIPVRPASIANQAALDAATFDEPMENYAVGPGGGSTTTEDNDMIIPPKLKILAGFTAEEDVTIEKIIAALETQKTRAAAHSGALANEGTTMDKDKPVELTIGDEKFSVVFANEASGKLPERITQLAADLNQRGTDLANEKKARGEERKARAVLVVETLVGTGKIKIADRDTKVEELCNAADFDAKAKEFANVAPVVKTKAKTTELAGKHAVMNGSQEEAGKKFDALMSSRAAEFPNETYQDRFAAVCSSEKGEQLIGMMKRSSANGEVED